MKKSMLLIASIFSLSTVANLTASYHNHTVYSMSDEEYINKALYAKKKNNATTFIANAKFNQEITDARNRNNKHLQLTKQSNQAQVTSTPVKKLVVGSQDWIDSKK